jgi:uncharacterized protein (TIGR02453 family)
VSDVFEGFSQRTIDFMWGIRLNNEKTWYDVHKDEYKRDFQLPMKELGNAVYERIASEAKARGIVLKLSRIHRDARRLHGTQGPYRDSLWFSIEKPSDEWTAEPVFWFELSPEAWSYGLGYYLAKPMTMAKLRARLDRESKKFERLVAFLDKQDEFVLDGPEYVRKKEAPTAKTAAWYNKKSFSLIHRQENGEELYSPGLVDRIASGFKSLLPLYDYLITVDSDPTPGE